jgi:Ca2+-binding RTX toxin-like protein
MELMTILIINLKLWLKPLRMFVSIISELTKIHDSRTTPPIIGNIYSLLHLLFFLAIIFFFISNINTSVTDPHVDYEYLKAYGIGIQTPNIIAEYSDSIIPQKIINENEQDQNHSYSSMIDANIPKIIVPSSPSSSTTGLLVDGNNNHVILDRNNTNNVYEFSGNEQQLNSNYGSVDSICGYITTVKIGYIITGTGNISGNDKDNYIIGSEINDLICGKRGNDVIMGLGGNDIIYAGKGDDTLYGGDGNNQLFGEDGEDNIIGGPFNDLLVGGRGDDHIASSTGDDIMIGGDGADYFECGSGLNTVVDFNPINGDLVSNGCAIVNNISNQ